MATNPSTFLIKTVRGSRRQIFSYDADLFKEKISLSVSLIIKDIQEIGLYDIPFDSPDFKDSEPKLVTHYNTTHGAVQPEITTELLPDGHTFYQSEHVQKLHDLTVNIHPKPESTLILGHKNVAKNSKHIYKIDTKYGLEDFTYEWSIESGLATFEGSNLSKTVLLNFGSEDTKVILVCKITNGAGCYRIIKKNIYVGLMYNDLLVVRNTYL
jgi:hypothetical protein